MRKDKFMFIPMVAKENAIIPKNQWKNSLDQKYEALKVALPMVVKLMQIPISTTFPIKIPVV